MPHAYPTNVKTESWTPCTKMCWRVIWWPLRNNHCKWAWEQEEMIFIWATSLLHTLAGEEAGVQLQGAQLLFSNCLPKPSSIFHSFTEEKKKKKTHKCNRMWKLPPHPETIPLHAAQALASSYSASVICVSCINSPIPRANIGLSSSCVPKFSLYPRAPGNSPKSGSIASVVFASSV